MLLVSAAPDSPTGVGKGDGEKEPVLTSSVFAVYQGVFVGI